MATITVRPDLSPRLVIVNRPDTELTVQQAVDLIRDWEDSMEGMGFEKLLDAAGKEALGGGVEVGITATLQNAQIYFAARNTVHATGTVTTTNSAGEVLVDSAGTFTTDGIAIGDTVFNTTTSSMATVVNILGDDQIQTLPLYGGTRQDWQIGDGYQIYDNVQCNLSGGNLVAIDDVGAPLDPVLSSPNVQVVRTASSSATAQQLAAIEYAAYVNAVWVDASSPYSEGGYAEVGRPIGTPQDPVNNVQAAVAIRNDKGLPANIMFRGNYTLDTGDDVDGYLLQGENAARTLLTVNDASNTVGTEVKEVALTGNLDGGTIIRTSSIQNVNYINGFIFQCMIQPGTISLGGTTTAHILQSYSGVPGEGTPIITWLPGENTPLAIRDYNGGIKLTNKTGNADVSIDLGSGQVIIDSTCTNGTIVVRGDGKVVDENGVHMLSGTYNGNLVLLNECNFGEHVHDMWLDMGLDKNNPVTISDDGTTTTKSVGGITKEITDTSITRTV